MKCAFLFIFFLMAISSSFSSIPTIEGLFRNPNNRQLEGNLVVLKVEISDQLKVTKIEGSLEKRPRYYKLILSVDENQKLSLLQVEYLSSAMKIESLARIVYLDDFSKEIGQATGITNLAYSLYIMFSMNRSVEIKAFLQKLSGDFKSNKETMDSEKVSLLENYKNFLELKKRKKEKMKNEKLQGAEKKPLVKSAEEEIISPLKPRDDEEKKRVSDLQKRPMYNQMDEIQLIREGKKFFWFVNLQNVKAYFSNNEHRIKKMKILIAENSYNLLFSEYLLFNGKYEMPKEFLVKTSETEGFRLKTLGLNVFTNTGKSISERAKEYEEKLVKVLGARKKEEEGEAAPLSSEVLL